MVKSLRDDAEQEERERKGEEEDGHGPPSVGDFGMHYPISYVRRAVFFLRQFNTWPESGGWMDQDGYLLDDIHEYVKIERRVKWEVKHGVTHMEEIPADAPKAKL